MNQVVTKFFNNVLSLCTISTALTFLRIILTPFIGLTIYQHEWRIAFVLFCIAAITDFLDGFLARFLEQETEFGAYIDPVADKILLGTCFLSLALAPSSYGVPLWFVILLLIKELFLVGGALYFGLVKKMVPIKPTHLGKGATVLQILYIILLFINDLFYPISHKLLTALIYSCTFLIIITFIHYTWITIKGIR